MSGHKRTELEDLSPEQQEVVRTWGKGTAVIAGAGSGKTTTLVIKCAELLKRNPDARFAAVSFTEKSASDLREKLAQRLSLQGEGGALSGHWVMTIHGLCGAIIREYPREAGFDGEESMLSEPEAQLLWERVIDGLWFDELPEAPAAALQLLLERESRAGVLQLLKRMRELSSFGALGLLSRADEAASRALSELGKYVLEKYDRLKRRRGAVDFNDLERGADRALEYEHVRENYRRRFDLVLVDEFQDTNPLQSKIILRFCRADLSNLCVVGDPKQSIYRFRDADVSVFEEFCHKLPVRHVLSWNFRSRPDIIHFTNQVCGRAFEAVEMRYDPLEPKREAQAEGEAVVRLDVRSPADLGAWVRAQMDRGVGLHEMALLVRRVRGNEKWLKALTAAGIPIAVGSGGLFWEDPRVRELVAFLKWWDQPANALSGAVFLRSPWVAVPDRILDQWVRQDPTLESPFFESEHPLARELRKFRGRVVRPGELLTSLLIADALEDEIGAPLLGLWHRVEELSSRGLDFHSVVLELGRALEESRRERDVPPPRNLGQLSVLTFHSSKGLEFPHVILIDFGTKPRAHAAPVLFWDRERGAYLSPRDADGERDKKNPLEISWRELEKGRNLAESMRIFYVALTRARERLILVCPELDEEVLAKARNSEAAYRDEWWRAWIESSGVPIAEEKLPESLPSGQGLGALDRGSRPARGISAAPVVQRPRHSVTEWNLLSRCPLAYEWKYIRPRLVSGSGDQASGLRPQASGIGTVNREPSTEYRELGTEVHSCLERADWQGLREIEARVGADLFQSAPLIEWAENSGWMQAEEFWTELAFEVPVGSEVLVGSIDRLVKTEQGKYVIVDFKVSGFSQAPETLIANYGTQMELYASAVSALTGVSPAEVTAVLVQISPSRVREVRVPCGKSDIGALAKLSAAIVNGQTGEARPGKRCEYCDFRAICPYSVGGGISSSAGAGGSSSPEGVSAGGNSDEASGISGS